MYVNKRLLIVVLVFAAIIISPVVILFVEGVRNEAGGASLDFLKSLLLTPRQMVLIRNSLVLAGGATIFSLLIGTPLAFLINRTDLPCKSFFNFAYLLPLIIPPYMHAIIWVKFFNSYLGGLSGSIYSLSGGILVYTLSFFPFVTLIVSSGLRSIDQTLEEASYMSKGFFKTIRGVTLPLVTPHITSAAILVFVFTIVNFEAADILRLKVYPMEIFINFSAFYNEKAATILSLPLMAVTLLLIWGQMLYMKNRSYANLEVAGREECLFRLGRFKPLTIAYALVVLTLAVAIPLIVLTMGAGVFQNYVKAFIGSRDKIFYSIYVAALSSFIMVILSFGAAYYIERGRGFIKTLLDFITQTPFGVPSIVLGIGLIKVWNRPGLDWVYGTSAILVIGYMAGYSPFVIKIISTRIKQIDVELEEAAIMADIGWFKMVGKILLPLSLPTLIAGFLAGFVLSLGNLGTALLIASPGKATIPISIYNFMHYGGEHIIFSLNLILILIMILSISILYPLYRYSVKKIRI